MKRLITFMFLAASTGAVSADQNLLFILDASGSMWGQIEGTPKISVAKEVMSGLVQDLPAESKTGLLAYGHRRKGDCSDIESLVGLGPLQPETFIERVQDLNPKGKTPITDAVEQAIQQLRQVEESASIVLVSDGLESCGGDPCKAVKAAKQSGVDFRLHVVGFNLGDADPGQLQCMAEAGGGEFFTAGNAGELSGALEQVTREPAKVDVILQAVNGEDGPVLSEGLRWTLSQADADPPRREGSELAKPKIALRPGNYQVSVLRIADETQAERDIEVKAGEPNQLFQLALPPSTPEARVSAPRTATAGALLAVEWTGPDARGDYLGVYQPDQEGGWGPINDADTEDGNPARLRMPPEPGKYEIRYVLRRPDKQVLARQTVTVEPVEASIRAPETAKAGATIDAEWSGPNYRRDYIGVYAPEKRGGRGSINHADTDDGNPARLQMPPEAGDYEIRYIQRQGREVLARQAIRVEAVTASLNAPQSAPAGTTIPVEWTGPNYQRDYIGIYKPDQRGGSGSVHHADTDEGSPAELRMPQEPGEYEIRYVLRQDKTVVARHRITVD